MRLQNAAHTSRPWRIHQLTPDFRLQDVWALPTPGGRYEFPRLVRGFASNDEPSQGLSGPARALWVLREKLGQARDLLETVRGTGYRLVEPSVK